MDYSHRSKKILLVGDSRIRHLDVDLNSRDPAFAFVCKCLPGACFLKVVQTTREIIIKNNTFSMIILLAGINDVTELIKQPERMVKIRFSSVNDSLDYLRGKIDEGIETLQNTTQIPFTICPLVGIDLKTYSPTNDQALYQQPIVDQAVCAINKYIYSINKLHHIPTPLLESTIHKCKGKTRKLVHHYDKLHDGCHPDPATRETWASLIYKAVSRYLEL